MILSRNIQLFKNIKYTNFRGFCSGSGKTNGVSTELSELPIYFHRDLTSNKDIFLIGSVHVSKDSAKQVEKFIQDVKPDTVVLELCDQRYRKLRNDLYNQDLTSYQQPQNSGNSGSMSSLFEKIQDSMKSGTFTASSIFDLITKNFYGQFKVLGLVPGLEFLYAIREADKLGAEIVLGDINSQDTLKKLAGAMNSELLPLMNNSKNNNNSMSPELQKLYNTLGPLTMKLTQPGITEKELEVEFKKLLNNNVLKEIRSIFERELPITYEALLIGRERNIVRSIKQSKGNTIVTVVGALHVDGVKQLLNLPLDKILLPLSPPPISSLLGLLGSNNGGGNIGGLFSGMNKFLK